MLTIEIRLNGHLIAQAAARNVSQLADISDYHVTWHEAACPELGIEEDFHKFTIEGHRRGQTAWALVAKVVMRILGQMTGDQEGKG